MPPSTFLNTFLKKHNDFRITLEHCLNKFWTCFEQLRVCPYAYTDRPTYKQADRRSHDHSHRSHDYHHLFFMRLQMDQASSVDPAPEPSGKATRGPGGPASRWANFCLGVLGYRTRQRRPKLRSFERGLWLERSAASSGCQLGCLAELHPARATCHYPTWTEARMRIEPSSTWSSSTCRF